MRIDQNNNFYQALVFFYSFLAAATIGYAYCNQAACSENREAIRVLATEVRAHGKSIDSIRHDLTRLEQRVNLFLERCRMYKGETL